MEIVPKSGFYDYTSKYTKGMTEYIVPAPISEADAKRISSESEKVFLGVSVPGQSNYKKIIKYDRFDEVKLIREDP